MDSLFSGSTGMRTRRNCKDSGDAIYGCLWMTDDLLFSFSLQCWRLVPDLGPAMLAMLGQKCPLAALVMRLSCLSDSV